MMVCYRRFVTLFDEKSLSWLLESALDRSTLVKLGSQCGIKYHGIRTRSVASHLLGSDLSRQFFENESTGETVLRFLSKLYFPEIEAFGINSSAFHAYGATSDTSIAVRQLCRLVLTLARDDREEAHIAIPGLVARAQAIAVTVPEPPHRQAETSSGELSELARRIAVLETELERAGTVREGSEPGGLEATPVGLKDQVKQVQAEVEEIRHSYRVLERSLAEKDRELARLRGELAELPRLTAQVTYLERENRILRDQVGQSMGTQAVAAATLVGQSFERAIHETHDTVRLTGERIQSEYSDLRRMMGEVQKELQILRIDTQSERQTGRSPRPARQEHERVGIFVDVQNMFYAARLYDARLDFEKLMQAAVGDRRMIRAMAYLVQTPDVDQSGFIAMLQQRSYQVKRKDLRLRSDGSAKGDWDMGMAIDIIGMADKLDVVVLVSGDGDFVSLVHLLKEIGPSVEVFSFPHNTARDLVEAADRYVPIDESLLMRLDRSAAVLDRPSESAGASLT